jgi:hypothetical protein
MGQICRLTGNWAQGLKRRKASKRAFLRPVGGRPRIYIRFKVLPPPQSACTMHGFLVRGGAVWQLVGLITRRSQVQILPPLPLSLSLISLRLRCQPASCKT